MVLGEDRLNLSALYGAQGLSYVLSVLMLPYLTRVLGPEAFGVLAYSQSFGGYLALVVDLGLGLHGERLVARARANPGDLPSIAWHLVAGRLGLALLGFGIAAVAMLILRPAYAELLLIAALNALIGQNFPAPILIGLEKQRYSVGVGLAQQTGLFLFSLAFVREAEDLKSFLLASLCLSTVALLGGLVWLFRSFGKPSWQCRMFLQLIRDAIPIYAFQLTVGVYNSLGPFLLFHLKGAEASAVYAVSAKLVKAILGLWGPFFALIPPKLSYWYGVDPQRARFLAQTYLRSALLIGGGLSCTLIAFAPLVPLFVGSAYSGSVLLTLLLSPIPLLVATSNVLGLGLAFARRQDHLLLKATLSGALAFLGLGVPLMWGLGPHGASIALTLAEGVVTFSLLRRTIGGMTWEQK